MDFKDAYAEKAREPIRNKARFNSALAEALRDVERRDDGFVPPAVHPRGRAGRHGRDDPKPAARDDARPQPVPNNARDDAEKEGFDKEPNEKSARTEKGGAAASRENETAGARGGTRGGPGETAGFVSPPSVGGGSRKSRGGGPADAAFEAKATAASALVAEATLAAAPETPAPGTRAPRARAGAPRRRRGGRGGPNQDGGVRVPLLRGT